MSLVTALAVLGVLATVVFGALAIFLAVRHRYPGQITFVEEQTIALFDEIARNLPDLEVLYRRGPISPNAILVRAALVNTGSKDIAPSMVAQPLSLRLPDDCKWLSPTVIGSSDGVTASLAQPNDAALTVSTSLLRCKEFVRLQVLAEVPPAHSAKDPKVQESSEDRFEKGLRFEHRIQDTQPVKRVELAETGRMRKRLRRFAALPAVGVLALVFFAFTMIWTGYFKRFAYQFQPEPGKTITVTAQLTRSALVVRSLDGSYHARISPEEFFAKCSGVPTVINDRHDLVLGLSVAGVLYLALPLAMFLSVVLQYRTDKKLRRILGVG